VPTVWVADPLHPTRRADDLIVRDGVAGSIVAPMCPLVNVFGPGLGGFCPLPGALNIRHTFRRQHAHHVGHRRLTQILGHDQIHQIVNVRQVFAVEPGR